MTRIWLTRFGRLSVLASLLLSAGCAGSSLGDRVGQSLEADPQLVEGEPKSIVITDPEADTAKASDSSDKTQKDPSDSSAKDPVE
ncbi:MAG: S-layer homology domain-containing protein, partial [Phormidesmis sp.]